MTTKYKDFASSRIISFDTETKDPNLRDMGPGTFRGDGFIIGYSLADESGFAEYYNVGHPDCSRAEKEKNLDYLREVMALPVDKVGVNTQYDVDWITNGHNIPVNGNILDCMIAESLLDENLPSYSLEEMAQKYFKMGKAKGKPEAIAAANGWTGDFRQHLWRMNYPDVREYGVADAAIPIRLIAIQRKLMEAQELMPVFELECRVTKILIEMRMNGVRLDSVKRDKASRELRAALDERKASLDARYGKFNYNSSAQIAKVLDKLGAPYARRTEGKDGKPATNNPILDAHAMKRLSEEFPVCNDITEVKKIDKILNTFIDGSFVNNLCPDGRLHASFYNTKTETEGGLAGTRSGRFSCLAKGTLIPTDRGIIPIEDVRRGDFVISHTGKLVLVLERLFQGKQDAVILETEYGASIMCTADHKFFTPTGWEAAAVVAEIYYADSYTIQQRYTDQQHAWETDVCKITGRTDVVGQVPVYDIVIADEDHSFIANGFLAHNCAKPNLQQIPSYDAKEKDDFKKWYTHLCRELFIPEEDQWWLKIDYSQIEYRFMAHFAVNAGPFDTSADDVRAQYNSDPHTDYHEMIQTLTGLPRKLAKNLNFGVGYGMGKGHMIDFFGWEPEYCDEVLATYHSRAPFVKATMNAVSTKARIQGFIRTFLKRRSRLIDSRKAYIMFCRLCQGSAADLAKKAIVDIYDAGLFSVLTTHLTVHDEFDWSMPKTREGIEAGMEAKHLMETALVLQVPVIAEAEIGTNWVDLEDFNPEELLKSLPPRRRVQKAVRI